MSCKMDTILKDRGVVFWSFTMFPIQERYVICANEATKMQK